MQACRKLTKYREVFGEETRSNHKQFLFRRIAWRIQANAWGGLSERARRRALEPTQPWPGRAHRARQRACTGSTRTPSRSRYSTPR